MTAQAHAADRPVLGILLMCGFCVLAPLADGLAKLIGDTVPLVTLLLARFVFQVVLLAPFALQRGAAFVWSARITALVALRGVLHILGIATILVSLRYLPLAEAIAIAYVMPFVLLLLGWQFLGEEVGARRIAACAVGFAGTLMVIRPSFADVGAAALLPLAVAVVFALFMLVTRAIARVTDPMAVQVTSGAVACMLLLPVAALGARLGPDARAVLPGGSELGILVTLCLCGTLGHLLMTWSLRFVPASTVAPMQYLEIPVATVIGWLLFRDFPDGTALAGIAVTVAAGLYVIARERALSRAVPPPAPRGAPPAEP